LKTESLLIISLFSVQYSFCSEYWMTL
jgi:hypothetical protein